MRIAAHRGTRLHAPENSIAALLCAYTAGADVLEFDLQLTLDGHLVLSHDGTIDRLTGKSGKIIEMNLAELRKLDFSATYRPRGSPDFKYYPGGRVLPIALFTEVLEIIPDDVELLIELKHDSSLHGGRRAEFVKTVLDAIALYGVADRTIVYSKDSDNLRAVRAAMPGLRIAAFDFELDSAGQLALLKSVGADGLVVDLGSVLQDGELTDLGRALRSEYDAGHIKSGAILYPFRDPGVFTEAEWSALKNEAFVWSLSTDSMLEVAFCRRSIPVVNEKFVGKGLDRDRFALGYAKANTYATVTQDDGIHIDIGPYTFSPPVTDPLELRLERIEDRLTYVAREWPYYSGGGVGHVPGVRGDFVAEVSYTVQQVAQATTLEMAALNVDPGAHQAKPPTSFRGKDSFYDPHGAPPYVGVEHDEDDGYRINWNLGSEYDNNQYGKPVGNGKALSARLRLERRGAYFASYYRNADARDWVCCGVVRNYSLNPVVYLRCVAKRWRQESEKNPDEYMPVIPNHYVFKDWTIERFI